MEHQPIDLTVDWHTYHAAVWRRLRNRLQPIAHPNCDALADLVGISRHKTQLLANTKAFVHSVGGVHTLLRGARGCGKSSLVRAMLPVFAKDGLRMIQLDTQALIILEELTDQLKFLPYKFIVLCDDVSFDGSEPGLAHLKTFIEGSLEAMPDNILLYVTTNRRHLLPESANKQAQVGQGGELHVSDSIDANLSLADRFGLWISFHTVDQNQYLGQVSSFLTKNGLTLEEIQNCRQAALRFARQRGVYSARTAKHFVQSFLSQV